MAKEVTQVKFSIDSDIVSSFKARCASEGVSMASVICRTMSACKPSRSLELNLDTRPFRRKSLLKIIGMLEELLSKEEEYKDAIPEQFESRLGASEQSCEQITQAIACLEEAY